MKNQHLEILVITTNDLGAQIIGFKKEVDLCSFLFDINDGIESDQIYIFALKSKRKNITIECVSHDCACDVAEVGQALDKFFNIDSNPD